MSTRSNVLSVGKILAPRQVGLNWNSQIIYISNLSFFCIRPEGARCVLPGWMGERIEKRARWPLNNLCNAV